MSLQFLALLLVLQAAGGHVGLSLAVSPCARLLQQVGDDLHSLLVGLLHSLSSSNLRLRDLHYDLIHLNTYQLAQEFQVLTESSQHLLGCGCGSCRPGLTLEEAHLKVQRRNAQLSQRLKKLWQLIQPETELHLTFAFEEVDFRLRATADESSQVLFLLKASDLLHGHLEQLKKTLEVILQQAPSLLRKPGATERSKLLELLENPPLHLIGTPSGRMKLLRSHVLCNAEEPPDSAWTPWTPWMDASSATWHGMSSLSWLQRLKRPSKRVCSVLPFGMPGIPPCANAHGILYNPTSCLMEQGWSAVSLLVEGNVVMEVSEQLHVPGHSIQRSISWPMEDAADLLFIHPMAGSCTLLDKVVRESSQLPKLVYVGINPLLPPPIRAAPDFIHHWKNHQQLSQQVLASQSEEPEAWAVRSMSSHFLAQCSLSQAAAMLRKDYVLLQVEHLFAVFAQKSILKELQLQDSMGGVAEFEAWRRSWFCSPLSPVLLSLEQLAGTDDQWLSIGAMTQEDAQQAAVSLGCDFLERQELLPDQVHMKCEVSRHLPQRDVPPWQQRLRVQWSLKQLMCPGVALQLAQEGHGHCPVHGGNTECECFAPWRGLHCNILDATEAAQARNYSAAVQYIVNEDPIHLAELRHSLRNFWRRFNKNFDYPVQVFHDGLSDETRASLVRASPNRIWFHHLPEDFLPPVEKLPPELVVEDETRTVSHHTFSAGYRAQCRFRAGPLFEHPAVASLDYLMSLDTDSMLPAELARDPFLEMHQNSSKVLGYSKLAISSSAYVRGLWAAVLQYLAYEGINLTESRQKAPGEAKHFLQRFLLDQSKDTLLVAYNSLVAMTDFEVLRVSFFKPGSDYFRFYRFIDELGGFWLYRWGDHAIRGLGTAIALFPHEVKQASDGRLVAYDLQVPYAHQDTCLCQDPKLRCADRGKAASGEALWPETKKVWECIPKT